MRKEDRLDQLSIPEAARRLGVSQDTIRRRIRRGELQAVQHPTPQGHVWLVEIPDVRPDPRPASDVELLRQEVGHWRELANILREELVARRHEVHELLLILEQTWAPQAPGSRETERPARELDGSVDNHAGASPRRTANRV